VNQRLVWRRLLSLCAALLLLALSWWTLTGGLRDVPQSRTIGQQLETAVRLACSLLSLATAVTRVRWGAWARRVRIAWGSTLAAFLGLSALVWGAPQPHVALLFVAVALLLAWAIVWALGPALAAEPAPQRRDRAA
jgi:peptidoglycan/LPS O-acetylase OafA/YrhL